MLSLARSRPQHSYSRTFGSGEPPHTRRPSHGISFESDDDDESAPDTDSDTFRRNSELFFSQSDEEHAIAAMRGQMLSGKRIPSQSALAALENVDPLDLKEADRSKTIYCAVFYVFC